MRAQRGTAGNTDLESPSRVADAKCRTARQPARCGRWGDGAGRASGMQLSRATKGECDESGPRQLSRPRCCTTEAHRACGLGCAPPSAARTSIQRNEEPRQDRETAARRGADRRGLPAHPCRESLRSMPRRRPSHATPHCSGLASLAAEFERWGRGNESQGATPPESGALARKRVGAWRCGHGRARQGLCDRTEQRASGATGSPRRGWARRCAAGKRQQRAAASARLRARRGPGSGSQGRRPWTVEMRNSEASSKTWSVG